VIFNIGMLNDVYILQDGYVLGNLSSRSVKKRQITQKSTFSLDS